MELKNLDVLTLEMYLKWYGLLRTEFMFIPEVKRQVSKKELEMIINNVNFRENDEP